MRACTETAQAPDCAEAIAGVPVNALAVPVAGGTLAAVALGPPDAPPLLAVHGITSNAFAWLPVAAALGKRARLIAPDLRGRARSATLPEPYGTAAYVADLVALLDHLGLGRLVASGHSLGAYVVARLAVEHPDRVSAAVLVDGGLTLPDADQINDPQAYIDAFLGPALARLRLRFASLGAYLDWWRDHPAMAGQDVAEPFLRAYVKRDATGMPPEVRSSVREQAVRADAEEVRTLGIWAQRLEVPARLLCAPLGLLGEPNPMQPLELARAWAGRAPGRGARLIEGTNHYTITLGRRGADAVAKELAQALAGR
jgi:lipase